MDRTRCPGWRLAPPEVGTTARRTAPPLTPVVAGHGPFASAAATAVQGSPTLNSAPTSQKPAQHPTARISGSPSLEACSSPWDLLLTSRPPRLLAATHHPPAVLTTSPQLTVLRLPHTCLVSHAALETANPCAASSPARPEPPVTDRHPRQTRLPSGAPVASQLESGRARTNTRRCPAGGRTPARLPPPPPAPPLHPVLSHRAVCRHGQVPALPAP